ncbi:hypothetical protein AURDEDRAFT_186724 [Auricularia subglabra TFB-10046 SS5]|nr:hypothetical protein AURDEDRAFT_186724 [Auricularia subglabra TFB-10046 SS5]
MTRRTRLELLRANAKRQDPSKGVSSGPGGQQPPGQQAPGSGSDEPGMSDAPGGGGNPTGGQGTELTGPPGQAPTPPGGGDQGANPTDQPGQGGSGSPTVTAPPGSNPSQTSGTGPTSLPGSGNGHGGDSGNGGGLSGIPGSGSGTVNGPGSGRHGLSSAAITAILLSVLLVLAILALAARLLWRRYRERRRAGLRVFHRPQLYTQTSFQHDPQMAERLRGGLIDPYNGAASASTLSSQYRIEPFAVPPRRPPRARANSSAHLLDDPAIMTIAREEKRRSSPLPRGAMNLAHHGHTFPELEGAPFPTPGSEEETVFELPPTYASLNQPQPMRRWYRFWQSSS